MIAVFAAIFSAISVLVTTLSMIMENSLIKSQQYTFIKMDVIGKSVQQKSRKCRRRVRKLRQGISGILGIDYGLIEMLKPINIPKGLEVHVYLYGITVSITDNKYESLLTEAQQNGSLAECIYQAWNLSSVPDICNIEFMQSLNSVPTPKLRAVPTTSRHLSKSIFMHVHAQYSGNIGEASPVTVDASNDSMVESENEMN